MKQFTLTFVLLCFGKYLYCRSNIFGYYTNNFSEYGFSSEQLQLNEDSTFLYKYSFDLMNYFGKGHYKFKKDTIYFSYEPTSYDTISQQTYKSIYKKDTNGLLIPETEIIINKRLNDNPNRPVQLFYKKNKLHCIINGKVGCKSQPYNSKRFKEYYLLKRKDSQWHD